MTWVRACFVIYLSFLLSVFFPPLYAAEDKANKVFDSPLVGTWEIFQTKEPGKSYSASYRGRPFVSSGPHSFTLILEYRPDGNFRRISRVNGNDSVQEGSWKLDGPELRQKRKDTNYEEVFYIRFDGPNQYTSIEVYEDSADPGLFARFMRVK